MLISSITHYNFEFLLNREIIILVNILFSKKPIIFSGQFTIYSQNNQSWCAGSKFIGSNKQKIALKS